MADKAALVINTFSYIWSDGVEGCLSRLADQGYRRFEILLTSPHLWPADFDAKARASLRRFLDGNGLEILSINPGGFDNNLASPATDVRQFAQNYLIQVIDLATDIGARTIVASPGVARPLLPPPRESLMGWLKEGMDLLIPRADAAGLHLCLENIPFSFLPRADQLMEAISEIGAGQLRVVYDVANGVFAGEDPCTGLRQVLPLLQLVHLSDTGWKVWKHDPVGTGAVPFEAIGVMLRKSGYSGPIALEIISPEPDRDIAESVNSLTRLGW